MLDNAQQRFDEMQFPFPGFNPPTQKHFELGAHRPWKTVAGLVLFMLGAALEFFGMDSVYTLGSFVQAVGVVLTAIGVTHALARQQIICVRSSIRARNYPFSFMPPLMIVTGAIVGAVGLLLEGSAAFLGAASGLEAFGAVAAVGGWRWWCHQITTAVGG